MKYRIVAAVVSSLVFSTAHADNTRGHAMQQLGETWAYSQCAVVLMKEGQTTVTPGRYVADSVKLHKCQYVQEMVAIGCVAEKSCPSYKAWSKDNPDFTPGMPRAEFEEKLDFRQFMVSAWRRASN